MTRIEKLQPFCLFIILLMTALVFAPSIMFNFVNWDDYYYVVENPLVRELSWGNLQKIFSSDVMGNYQPLVVLSLAIDYARYGLHPSGYHLTNIIFHLLNVCLVFVFLRLLKLSSVLIICTTFLFALHPLRVESVVWITERKDVLFLFFYMMSLNFYILSRKHSKFVIPLNLVSFIFFVCSLLSKPSAVSLPVVLILLDWFLEKKINLNCVISKLPFFLFSAGLSLRTIKGYGSPVDFDYLYGYVFKPIDHFFMGFYSLWLYWFKLLWPVQLSCFYPYPVKTNGLLPFVYYISPVLTTTAAVILYRWSQNKKLFVFGFLFFVVTIFTNLAFFNFGLVLIADRYTYLPSLGFFLIFIQLLSEKFNTYRHKTLFRISLMVLIIFITMTIPLKSFCQTSIWRNSEELWSNVIRMYPHESLPHFQRGHAYLENHKYQQAILDYSVVIDVDTKNFSAPVSRGLCYLLLGEDDKAFNDFKDALKMNPNYLKVHYYLSEYFFLKGRYKEALNEADFILSMAPDNYLAILQRNKLIEKMKSSP